MKNNFFQWDSEFETGHKKIDEQHYSLIMTINELMALTFQSETIEDQNIKDIEKKLKKYTSEHFRTEEELMVKFNIDSRLKKEHEDMHREFIERVKVFFKFPMELKNINKLSEVNEFLVRWLAYHFLSMDKKLIRQINMIQDQGLSPAEAYEKESNEHDGNAEPLLKALKALFFLLSQKNKELEQINERLEEKVNKRTSDLEKANQRLGNLTMVDDLTGLPNRRFVMQEISQLMNDWKRYKVPFSVLFIDLDEFKTVNDNCGHECGDQVLKWVSEYIQQHIRKNDFLCRFGGDEFVIISPHCNADVSLALAEKLFDLIGNLKIHERPSYWKPSFSVGIIEMNDTIGSVSDILTKADSVMYESKRAGGGSASVFSEKNGNESPRNL